MPTLTRDYLRSILNYDPETGVFRWKWREGVPKWTNTQFADKEAGTLKDGYIVIMIDGCQYRAHRLATIYMTGVDPNDDVDHRDLSRSNNRWKNLRPATRSQNHANRANRRDNTSGHKGVTWHVQSGRWRVRVASRHICMCDTKEEAAEAYARAAKEMFGEFARAA